MNLLNSFKKFYPILLYLLFSLIFLFPIVVKSGIPFKYDWTWPLFVSDYSRDLTRTDATGLVSLTTKNAELFFYLAGLLRITPELFFKIFILSIHTIAGYGYFLLMQNYIKNRAVCFIVGLAYAFTPYIFIRTIVGFTWSLLAYALFPVFFRYYFLENKKIIHYFILGILFALIAAQNQAGILTGLVMFVSLVVGIFYHKFISRLKAITFTMLTFIALNIPWIILTYSPNNQLGIVAGSSVTTLSYIANLPHSFRSIFMFSDHVITKNFFYSVTQNTLFLVGYSILWIIALFSLANKKNREITITFLASSILVLPLIKGPTGIFGGIFSWIFNHFPLIAVFRETYHFEFLLAISFCILFGVGLDGLYDLINRLKFFLSRKVFATSAKAMLASASLFIVFPYLTFDYAGYLHLQELPPEYEQLHSYFQKNPTFCRNVYYPPGLGFIYFKEDKTSDAINSDVLGRSLGVDYLDSGFSVLNLPDSQSYYQKELISQYYEKQDNGELAFLMDEGKVDCITLRLDTESKYAQVSNLWREKDSKVVKKWNNTDLKSLMESKKGLKLEKQFGENIYIYKPDSSQQSLDRSDSQISSKELAVSGKTPPTANSQLLTYMPLTDWASNFAYYKDGWSRGRYDFWRKHLFAQLRQDFIYTDKQGSVLTGKIDQKGDYEFWARYLAGGVAGSWQLAVSSSQPDANSQPLTIIKDQGDEKFVWKKVANITLNGQTNIEIKNMTGENAIADLVLVLP